jgi:hypothetical protein
VFKQRNFLKGLMDTFIRASENQKLQLKEMKNLKICTTKEEFYGTKLTPKV